MSDLWYSPGGNASNPGTRLRPLPDPSVGVADEKYLAPGTYKPSGRVMAAKVLTTWPGTSGMARLDGGGVVDIGVSLINCVGTTVKGIEAFGYRTRGLHGGVTGDDQWAHRGIALEDVYVHDIQGQVDAIGMQLWGEGWTLRRVRVDNTRSDGIWCSVANLTMEDVVLINAGSLGEGLGDGIQAYVAGDLRMVGVFVDHPSTDKQAVLLSGVGVTLKSCVITGLSVRGKASGAGLVTIEGLHGVVGEQWNLVMQDCVANAGVGWISGASGTVRGGSLIGHAGAWPGLNNNGSSGVMSGFVSGGWTTEGGGIDVRAVAA